MSSSLPFPDTHFLHKHISDLFCEEWKTEIVDHPGWYLLLIQWRPQLMAVISPAKTSVTLLVIYSAKTSAIRTCHYSSKDLYSTDAYACHLFCADHSWFVSSIQRRAQLISVIYLVKISADVCHLSTEDLSWCLWYILWKFQLMSVTYPLKFSADVCDISCENFSWCLSLIHWRSWLMFHLWP
jgi:hypothetical protein